MPNIPFSSPIPIKCPHWWWNPPFLGFSNRHIHCLLQLVLQEEHKVGLCDLKPRFITVLVGKGEAKSGGKKSDIWLIDSIFEMRQMSCNEIAYFDVKLAKCHQIPPAMIWNDMKNIIEKCYAMITWNWRLWRERPKPSTFAWESLWANSVVYIFGGTEPTTKENSRSHCAHFCAMVKTWDQWVVVLHLGNPSDCESP